MASAVHAADIGGLKIAYRALRNSLKGPHKEDDMEKDGFTPDQRFFIGAVCLHAPLATKSLSIARSVDKIPPRVM
jgi:hypothetical protein